MRETGRDPAAFDLEIRRDYLDSELEAPLVRALFLPQDPARDHAVEVRADHPCAVTWLWDPPRFLARQREVIERASEIARIERPAGERLDAVEVVESRYWFGILVRLEGEPDLHVVLRKSDLTRIVAGEAGSP
jgi:hypothetical protein